MCNEEQKILIFYRQMPKVKRQCNPSRRIYEDFICKAARLLKGETLSDDKLLDYRLQERTR